MRFWNIFLILLVGILTIVPYSVLEYRHNEVQAHKELEQSITLQKAFVEEWLDERSSDIRHLANLVSTRRLELATMKSNLHSFQRDQGDFNAVIFVNEKGITQIDTSQEPGINVSDRRFFQAARLGKEYVSDAVVGKDGQEPIMIFSAPILDENNRFRGLIYGSVDISTIDRLLTRFRTGRTGETYILKNNGLMITESRFTNQLIAQGKVKKTTQLQYKVNTQIYQEALVNERSRSYYDNYLGKSVYGEYRWINHRRWVLIGEIQQAEVFAPYYLKLTEMIVSVLVVLLFGGCVLFNIIEKIKKMLYSLQQGVGEIQTRSTKSSLVPGDFRNAPVEIKSLYQAFYQMATTIENKISLLEESEARYRQLVELSPEAIMVLVDDQILLANHMAACVLHVNSAADLVGMKMYEFIHPDRVEEAKQRITQFYVNKHQQIKPMYLKVFRGDQQAIEIEVALSYITFEGRPAAILVFHDVTKRIEHEMRLYQENLKLQKLSQTDSLVGISNRRMFDRYLEQSWKKAQQEGQYLSLVMLDIDYFKEYNDTYGHQMGDQCLKMVAKTLDEHIRQSGGFIARYGGEEFAIILPEMAREAAFQLALNLRKEIEELRIPHMAAKPHQIVTISLGVAAMSPTAENQSLELLQQADKALYIAKNKGRNRVILQNS